MRDVCVEFCCQQSRAAANKEKEPKTSETPLMCRQQSPSPISIPVSTEETQTPTNGFNAAALLLAYEKHHVPYWSMHSNQSRDTNRRENVRDEDFEQCMRRHCAKSEPTLYNPEVMLFLFLSLYMEGL